MRRVSRVAGGAGRRAQGEAGQGFTADDTQAAVQTRSGEGEPQGAQSVRCRVRAWGERCRREGQGVRRGEGV